MAQFYGNIQSDRGEATRMVSKKNGISGHIRGWNVGIRVTGYVNDNGEDEFAVTLTAGSNGGGMPKVIGTFTKSDLV